MSAIAAIGVGIGFAIIALVAAVAIMCAPSKDNP
jgi:hypothetical protein